VHLVCDGKARPLAALVTAGQVADVTMLEPLLDEIRVPRKGAGRPKQRPRSLRVDRAYGARAQRRALRRRGIKCTCPERADARAARLRKGARGGRPPAFDRADYRRRNVVERCVNRLKDFRAVATRFEKRGRNFLAMVLVACIVCWL
jgi:transposase